MNLPAVEHQLSYHSGSSLLDFDIVVFDPSFPIYDREYFTNGGHCVSIASSQHLLTSMGHWRREILAAMKRGSTVFIVLNALKSESFALGTTSKRKGEVSYQTQDHSNYSAIPGGLKIRNSKGQRITVNDTIFKPLYSLIEEIAEFRVILENEELTGSFTARDGSNLGGVAKVKETDGNMVLLPYFNFDHMVEDFEDEERWTDEAVKISKGVIKQLVEIDKALKNKEQVTPPPDWITDFNLPKAADVIKTDIENISTKIATMKAEKEKRENDFKDYESYLSLLFASGKELESSIEKTLKLIGYDVKNYRHGDLEIDHIIQSPDGKERMIGETEGKDNSAVAISKFRQLESNINEDFERDEIELPARGVLFGNGFRMIKPDDRPDQFSEKCKTNAKRLGTALIRTSDLYPVALYIIDNPQDEAFKNACRAAIDKSVGKLVEFPKPPTPTG